MLVVYCSFFFHLRSTKLSGFGKLDLISASKSFPIAIMVLTRPLSVFVYVQQVCLSFLFHQSLFVHYFCFNVMQ